MEFELTICRHGESDGNKAKVSQGFTPGKLTSNGKLQATALGNMLFAENCTYDAVWCSDLNRVRETCDLALSATSTKYEINYSNLLREKNAGEFEGQPREQMERARKQFGSERRFKPRDGESWDELCLRIMEFVRKLTSDYANCNVSGQQIPRILIFTSGGVIKEFVNAFVNNIIPPTANSTVAVPAGRSDSKITSKKYYPNCAANGCKYVFRLNTGTNTAVMLVENKRPA